MFTSFEKKDNYNILMKAMMEENKTFIELSDNKVFKFQQMIIKIKKAIKTHNVKMISNFFKEIKTQYKLKKSGINNEIKTIRNEGINNYFSDEKIAVYTCIFGKYDAIQEPLCVPDNCDFYIVTDLDITGPSVWESLNIDETKFGIQDYSPAEKNRFFKMHPHLLFPEYTYSVYLDGNIKVIADPTAFINKIGKHGIAMHRHSRRACVYDEIIICDIYQRVSKESLEKHKDFLMSEGFPKEYGMCECNIIARNHNKEKVITMMEEWWKYYLNYAKRDQLSWPFVLYKNRINVDEVATLGDNVNRNYAVRLIRHEFIQKYKGDK